MLPSTPDFGSFSYVQMTLINANIYCFESVQKSNFSYIACFENTINSEIFARILFSQIMLKDVFAMLKFTSGTCFTYIRRVFYFHKNA